MQCTSIRVRNKSHLDCWIYVGAIEVHYLCAKHEIRIKIPEGEKIYVVSSEENVKHFGSKFQELDCLDIFF